MRIQPEQKEAELLLKNGKTVLLHTELVADLETPVSIMLKLGIDEPYHCLLESVEGGNVRGRFSVIALNPDLIWTVRGDDITIEDGKGHVISRENGAVFESLRRLMASSSVEIPDDLPPMSTGLFGYFGYEMIQYMEDITSTNPDELGTPDACLMRPSVVVIIDRLKDSLRVVTPVRPDSHDGNHETAIQNGHDRLQNIVNTLNKNISSRQKPEPHTPLPEVSTNMPKSTYLGMVKKAIEYIKAGDIFQVVLSQRFSVPFFKKPFTLYRSLRRLNPSPFLIYFNMGGYSLVGSSPEILVRLREGNVTIRPIAGTRPRGKSPEEDQNLAADLLDDAKERAEHLMLLDLGRNDVGRVSQPGTVKVVDHFNIERYSHVMHIASEVQGQIRPDLDAVDALKAGFPAGTLTGAPKIRAMEIIDELEPTRRGPYGGAAGYISGNGDMDSCIVLRTALIKDNMLYIQAGAGVVYDSIDENEYQECVNKAMAVIRAAAEAVEMPED